MDDAEAAYLAGLFDGEGSVYVNSAGGLRVQLANSNRSLCEAFLVFGGSIHISTKAGRVQRGYTTARDVWQWVGYRRSAERMEAALGRFLREKPLSAVLSSRRRADVA